MLIASFIRKHFLELALVLMVILATSFLYNNAYHRGYNAKAAEITQLQIRQSEELAKLSTVIENNSSAIIEQSKLNTAAILTEAKGKPMYKVDKAGKCSPSDDFAKAYKGLLK